MSSSVLYERLRELRAAGLVNQDDDGGYTLTPLGRDLGEAIAPLQRWAERWSSTARGRRSAQPATTRASSRRPDSRPQTGSISDQVCGLSANASSPGIRR